MRLILGLSIVGLFGHGNLYCTGSQSSRELDRLRE